MQAHPIPNAEMPQISPLVVTADRNSSPLSLLARAFIALLAIAVQVQPILTAFGGEVRTSLADPLAGLIGGVFAVVVLFRGVIRRVWAAPSVPWWLVLMTVVMTVALVSGYESIGRWTGWALFNKYAGWYALLAYFFAGAAVIAWWGTNGIRVFLQTFVVGACTIAAATITWRFVNELGAGPVSPLGSYRVVGLADNPNAFAFLTLSGLAAALVLGRSKPGRRALPYVIGCALLADGVFSSLSRAGWLAGVVLLAALLAFRQARVGMVAAALAIAALIEAGSLLAANLQSGQGRLGAYMRQTLESSHVSSVDRIRITRDAIALWREHPVFGAGLGVFFDREQRSDRPHKYVIHNSALWILAEMGLIGLVVFVGFAVFAVVTLTGRARGDPGRASVFAAVALAIIGVFVVMSLFHDLLYQRFLWLILGMGLARPGASVTARTA